MVASLRALLSGIIDYAGLFPPAALPLEQAIRNYARHRQEPVSWMLARFICSAGLLVELSKHIEALANGRPLAVSVLGGGGADRTEFYRNLFRDQVALTRFRGHQGRAMVEILELRLPTDVAHLPWPTMRMLQTESDAAVFCEVGNASVFPPDIPPLLVEVRKQLTSPEHPGQVAGFKLRCGGLDAAAFPSCEQVAFVIAACRDARVPLKFTAGLHHPIRHYNAGVQTHMHGFLNVFVAGVLAHARGLSFEQLRPIIEDEEARDFTFDDAGLRWKELHASIDEITAARRMVTSFGSCSFDEPRDDLRTLGWLP